MGELGSIGEEVLAKNNIKDIDVDAFYPGDLRVAIHEAAYQRFGSEALINFGFSMADNIVMPIIEKCLPAYRQETEQFGATQKALDLFMKAFAQSFDFVINNTLKHEDQEYGLSINKIGTYSYELNSVNYSLPNHVSFFEGIMSCYIFPHISAEWDHLFTFHPEKTTVSPLHCSFHWTLSFTPKSDRSKSSSELTSTYRLKLKERLLKKVIEDSNHSLSMVMSSVNYASRLQRGQLPKRERIKNRFDSFATIWEPRDTIGGDLYWLSSHTHAGPFILSLADCTGHGVPGAMLSLLVTNLFERIYATGTQSDPASALTQLDHYLRIGLNQDQVDSESDDGCDAMVLRIDPERQMIEFAGAKLNLYQVTSQKLVTRYVGARCSLGYKDLITTADTPVNQTIQYQSGDVFVAVTDGLTDQIGGPTAKTSYGYRRLADIIEANCKASAEEIAAAVKEDFAAWQGKNTRRDDLTAVFFKL
jgi:serine phosphatase RsbU (regulator of sigma subunit)